MQKPIAYAALVVIAGGCSGSETKAPAPDAAASVAVVGSNTAETVVGEEASLNVVAEDVKQQDVVCRREKPIGSNIGRRVCRPRGAVSPTRQGDQEELRRVQDLSDDDSKLVGE